nr:MAG TPA: hypothetical protein [Caudoviricetes sp.]
MTFCKSIFIQKILKIRIFSIQTNKLNFTFVFCYISKIFWINN